MKNKQKQLSWRAKLTAKVAIRTYIAKSWEHRRTCQKISSLKSLVSHWSEEIKLNIAAYRELNSI